MEEGLPIVMGYNWGDVRPAVKLLFLPYLIFATDARQVVSGMSHSTGATRNDILKSLYTGGFEIYL